MAKLLVIIPRIAPTSGFMKELPRIASGNEVHVCNDYVDRSRVAMFLETDYDFVHIITHGAPGFITLDDGQMEVNEFVSMLQNQDKVKLVFINACNGLEIAIAIHNLLHVPVIASGAQLSDEAAVRFAENFYRNLAINYNIPVAFQRARQATERLYGELNVQLINGDINRELQNEVVSIREALTRLENRLDDMVKHVRSVVVIFAITMAVFNIAVTFITSSLVHFNFR